MARQVGLDGLYAQRVRSEVIRDASVEADRVPEPLLVLTGLVPNQFAVLDTDLGKIEVRWTGEDVESIEDRVVIPLEYVDVLGVD